MFPSLSHFFILIFALFWTDDVGFAGKKMFETYEGRVRSKMLSDQLLCHWTINAMTLDRKTSHRIKFFMSMDRTAFHLIMFFMSLHRVLSIGPLFSCHWIVLILSSQHFTHVIGSYLFNGFSG